MYLILAANAPKIVCVRPGPALDLQRSSKSHSFGALDILWQCAIQI